MLEFAFTARDVSHTRFALSPLWEAVCSLRAIQLPHTDAPHQPWIDASGALLAGIDDLPLLLALVPPGMYIPDFLTPPPATQLPDLTAELEALAQTRSDRVRADLRKAYPGGVPEILEPLVAQPRQQLPRVAAALSAYWDAVIAPTWPRLREVLESDLVHRAGDLVRGGAARLFPDLHPSMSWDGESLMVDKDYEHRISLGGAGLLLIPSAFAWPTVLTISNPWQRPTLIYPARGVERLWEPPAAPSESPLTRLMGAQRALVLFALAEAASTTQLGKRLGITAGGVSQHLSVLRASALVTGHRSGRSVVYRRTELGDRLIAGTE